ncbi:MAG TPA: cyclic nucleotide-binding domain-containing protein, partial [Verrucomicrobiae bacterium]|nr:cyclic nucleotide-binding domain-containing protein [Verrucomicrobiae bacterium]
MSIPWERIPIFAGLSPEALDFLTGKAREIDAPAGEIVIREGEPGNKMFVIRAGEVKVWKGKKDGTQFVIARLKSGDFFGEMCILETLNRAATVEATTNAELFSLSSMTFYQFYQSMPEQYSILVLNIA